MTGDPPIEQAPALTSVMRRDRLIVAAALALACALAWLWLFGQGGRMGARVAAGAMGGMSAMGPAPATFGYWLGAFAMWSLMMVAMMLPSAAPMILLYARITGGRPPGRALPPTLLFAAVYVLVWTAFSAVAALAQGQLAASGVISASRLALGDRRMAGALLLGAGVYQATPLKRACLAQCQSPMGLVMQHWRPGWRGALALGLRHALVCLGCCWALMMLLFVGGVMNLPWVAFLAVLVLVEKLAPIGDRGAITMGAAAGLLGLALLAGLPIPIP